MDADVAGQTTIGIKPSPTGAVNGQLSKGTITSADLQEPLAGKHKYDLVNLLKSGVYINVHTSKNQDGEIRGQVS